MEHEEELKLLGLAADRLTARHPGFSRDVVVEVLAAVHASFADSPVRAFVPLLVERGAHHELTQRERRTDHRLVG